MAKKKETKAAKKGKATEKVVKKVEKPVEAESVMTSEVVKVGFDVFHSFLSVNARKVFMRVESSREEGEVWEFYLAFSPHSDFAELFKMIYSKLPGAEVHAYIGTAVPGTMPQLHVIIKV